MISDPKMKAFQNFAFFSLVGIYSLTDCMVWGNEQIMCKGVLAPRCSSTFVSMCSGTSTHYNTNLNNQRLYDKIFRQCVPDWNPASAVARIWKVEDESITQEEAAFLIFLVFQKVVMKNMQDNIIIPYLSSYQASLPW